MSGCVADATCTATTAPMACGMAPFAAMRSQPSLPIGYHPASLATTVPRCLSPHAAAMCSQPDASQRGVDGLEGLKVDVHLLLLAILSHHGAGVHHQAVGRHLQEKAKKKELLGG